MKKILFLLLSFAVTVHAFGQQAIARNDTDIAERLKVARGLVLTRDTTLVLGSTQQIFKSTLEKSNQEQIDKLYPSLDSLTRLRVLQAWTDTMLRHQSIFDRVLLTTSEGMAAALAKKYSLSELSEHSVKIQSKKITLDNLLTTAEMNEVNATQLSLIRSDIERLGADVLAMQQRLIQHGVISK